MKTVEKEEKEETPEEKERQRRIQDMPVLEQCYNLMDFEAVARRIMKRTAWGYYSSAADDEIVSFWLTRSKEKRPFWGQGRERSLVTRLLTSVTDHAREPRRVS